MANAASNGSAWVVLYPVPPVLHGIGILPGAWSVAVVCESRSAARRFARELGDDWAPGAVAVSWPSHLGEASPGARVPWSYVGQGHAEPLRGFKVGEQPKLRAPDPEPGDLEGTRRLLEEAARIWEAGLRGEVYDPDAPPPPGAFVVPDVPTPPAEEGTPKPIP